MTILVLQDFNHLIEINKYRNKNLISDPLQRTWMASHYKKGTIFLPELKKTYEMSNERLVVIHSGQVCQKFKILRI